MTPDERQAIRERCNTHHDQHLWRGGECDECRALILSLLTALAGAEAERDEERRLRLSLSDDSQRHLDRAVAAEARGRALTEFIQSQGYHAPNRCDHNLRHWIGDHCRYECAALAAAAPTPEAP